MANLFKEFQILVEYLEEKFRYNDFYRPLDTPVKALKEFDFTQTDKYKLTELDTYVNKITKYVHYKNTGQALLSFTMLSELIPTETLRNMKAADLLSEVFWQIRKMDKDEYNRQIQYLNKPASTKPFKEPIIFIGHGKNKLWTSVELFVTRELNISAFSFESEPRTGESITNILNSFLDRATFAILILTSEDETSVGSLRARQNVIHETGLFQGRLGSENVVLIKQNNVEDFSNVAGLQYLSFEKDNIEHVFFELQRVLKRQGIIK